MALQLSREQGIALRGSADIMAEFFYWLYKCSVQKLVVFISNNESSEVLERWQVDIECDKTAKDDSSTPRGKSQKAIQDEILSVIRQITATVTFLPLLEVSCSFDLLIYTKIWLSLKNGKSRDHSLLPILRKSVFIHLLLLSTK
ncbi:mitotic spindle assembly checkpoint protein MAD2A-like [Vulpes vulpes]|uniref:Mitotic spindle assembly checkpoint protein MAD2A-like n=1 Tax=Vulpes vulpes TaxID=9627 RepID=A0ABM5AEZ7_VULVU